MRLSDVLSKPIMEMFVQVEGFLNNRRLGFGKQAKIAIGKIALNFFCKKCNDDRTFCSNKELFCLGVNDNIISIDCVFRCPICDSSVQSWFLVESENDIFSNSPKVRILKRSDKLSKFVLFNSDQYNDFSELLEKAQCAYRDELGAGSIIYLRQILERITVQVAAAAKINTHNMKGRRKSFKDLLEEVDKQRSIIPKEFSANGYRLFSELSQVIHGNYKEDLGLKKYEALRRLVVGIIENVNTNQELMIAIGKLGWDNQQEDSQCQK
jgi:hypothetical protein